MNKNSFALQDKNSNEIRAIFSNIDLIDNDLEYYNLVSDLINNDIVLSMKNYTQHGSTTCYQHCVNVSYYSYKLAKNLGLDTKSIARAGLLHDLFLYDWHKVMVRYPIIKKHGFTHPQTALKNAVQYFDLNEIEEDIIVKHMWPLTLFSVPKYKESVIVSFVDKYCSTMETFEPLSRKIGTLVKKETI